MSVYYKKRTHTCVSTMLLFYLLFHKGNLFCKTKQRAYNNPYLAISDNTRWDTALQNENVNMVFFAFKLSCELFSADDTRSYEQSIISTSMELSSSFFEQLPLSYLWATRWYLNVINSDLFVISFIFVQGNRGKKWNVCFCTGKFTESSL